MLDERAQRERLEERETTTITIALTTSPTNKPPTRRDTGGGPGNPATHRVCNNITPQFGVL